MYQIDHIDVYYPNDMDDHPKQSNDDAMKYANVQSQNTKIPAPPQH